MSGDFVSTSAKIGALKIWNASHKSPRSTLKLGITGVKAFYPFETHPYLFLIAFKNGAVGIYNLELKKLEFSTQAAQTETIFDVKFNPKQPNLLGTVSYDGTVKIWDVQ